MQSLDAFLNNGRLPFVGRSSETERILAFAAGTLDARGLHVALITGEGGIGKSRFIEDLIPHLDEHRHLVVHVKFHSESHISLTTLLAHAIGRADIGLRLLKAQPEETLASVINSIRRCARLRPTIIILEDVEQLLGESVAELASFIGAIADETLAILCLARPVDLEVRSVLERYLVEEFTLLHLNESDVKMAWRMMFRSNPSDDVLDAVMKATRGNALAVRAALRGAVQSGALSIDTAGQWQLNIPVSGFSTLLQRNVRVVSQGLAAHLSNEEKQAASQLAALGEVFSREAAQMILDDADVMLETLMFKGIIATASTSVVAVNLKSSDVPPLVFTHTLTHQRLAEEASINPDSLVRLVAASPPIYSILPFQLLLEKAGSVTSSSEEASRAIAESLAVARILDNTAAWQKRVVPWGAATALISRFATEWDAGTCADMQSMLLRYDLLLHSRNLLDQRQLVDRIMQFTSGRTTRPMAEARLVALGHWLRENADAADALFSDVDAMLERHPSLAGDLSYCYFLGLACESLIHHGNHARLRQLEKRLEQAYGSNYLDEEGRRQLLESHLGLLLMFETEEELARRFDLLSRLESESQWLAGRTSFEKAELLLEIGRVDEAGIAADQSMKFSEERALREERWQMQTIQLCIRATRGDSMEVIDSEAGRLLDSIAEGRVSEHRRTIGDRLSMIALLRGEAGWAQQIADKYAGGSVDFPTSQQILLILASGDYRRFERLRFDDSDRRAMALAILTRMVINDSPIEADLLADLLRISLLPPLLRTRDILSICATIELVDALHEPATYHYAVIRDGLLRSLEWLGDPHRQLDAFMVPILERYGAYFSDVEIGLWRDSITDIRQRRSEQSDFAEVDIRVRVDMLGTIEVIPSGGEAQKISGLRLRTVLGLLVANQMLHHPLDYPGFCRIAAGTREYDKAARVATNGIIWRLRDLLGHNAINTDGETPSLDVAYVRVDLLEADRLLEDAMVALKSNVLVRAIASLSGALEIAGGKVPFPTLYDDFFEAIRSDFELRIQHCITRVTGELLVEGDNDGAAEILRQGLTILPGDGELTELLCQALTLAGKRADAERVRMREG